MIDTLWLIGIGTGSPAHVTGEGMAAIRDAAVILLPQKGEDKGDLAELRNQIIKASGSRAEIVPFDYPLRDENLPYLERVEKWHDEIANRWQAAVGKCDLRGPVALLVWGDPSLYDSTLRIAQRLTPKPSVRVFAGITSVQALTAAHAIPLNDVNGPIHITTGRRLRDEGWPEGVDRIIVMLDGEASFQRFQSEEIEIWWGAYLGMPQQILDHGILSTASERIMTTRAEARKRHGWIMDTYMLSRNG